MKKTLVSLIGLFFIYLWIGTANATLLDRGNGLFYDDILDITWIQDANLAETMKFGVSGISVGGGMNWYTANHWIDAMNDFEYKGYKDWRLPRTSPVNGVNYNTELSYDGSSDRGWNISATGSAFPGSTGSELAYMFYQNLSLSAMRDFNGNFQPGGGILSQPGGHPFNNLTSYNFWSGSDYPTHSSLAFFFCFFDGGQKGAGKDMINSGIVWAVRDGDSTPVPEPTTLILLGFGLLGVAGVNRRRK